MNNNNKALKHFNETIKFNDGLGHGKVMTFRYQTIILLLRQE